MRRVALVFLLVAAGAAAAAPAPRVPGAKTIASCAAAGPFWPTQTLALTSGTAWVACKEQGRIERIDLATGKRRSIPLGEAVIAVVAGLGAVWALDGSGSVARIDPGTARVTGRIETGASAPYNLWVGVGSLWSVDDAAGAVLRIDPGRRRVAASIPVGDGPADMVFSGKRAWVVNHRDLGLVRIDTSTNRASLLAKLPGDAPERLALLGGSLWVTGRGTDLLRVAAESGDVRATVEIGAGGIDVVAAGGSLWVPARAAAADRRGFPIMSALRRVDPSTGAVATVARPTKRVDVHGLVPYGRGVLLADNTNGALYRIG
jgi:DNA-binding beta-propeller fold protein YncE